ncbi:hypothetical protein ACFQY8_02015 [Alloscardovia venturai]|uniref:Protein kinase domain-containing protein n=1 Tax=Alloscardovia venturai TaxID=1769421 RepID=A0ABW2Y7H1_9BIFI
MNFAIGDVLLGRFRLVELLRDEPGFSVWIAHDNSLQRDCQISIVANSSIISRVNAAASALALSHNPHFTQVLHLHREGEVCVIVTDLDSGSTIRDYLTDHASHSSTYPLSMEAIRSIIGEVSTIVQDLIRQSLAHYCITDLTVRLTRRGIVLADFPVSAALQPPTSPRLRSTNHDVESIMVYQISALAFQLITGVQYHTSLSSRALTLLRENGASSDFLLICRRGLGLPDSRGRMPVPLVTIMELLILLDSWKPLTELITHPETHINVSRETSAPSITQAVIKKAADSDIAQIPQTLKDKPHGKSKQLPEWSASELIFGRAHAVDISSSTSNTDLFNALGELDETGLEREYDPYDFNDFSDGQTRTTGLSTHAIRAVSASDSHHDEPDEYTDHNVSRETSLPPSFAPQRNSPQTRTSSATVVSSTGVSSTDVSSQDSPDHINQAPADENSHLESLADSSAKTSSTSSFRQRFNDWAHTRFARILIVGLALIILLVAAVSSLGLGGSRSTNNSDPWSELSHETVRFPGQESNKGTNSTSSATSDSDKKASEKNSQGKSQTDSTQTDSQKKTTTKKKSHTSTQSTQTATVNDSDIKPISLPHSKSVSDVPTPRGTENTTEIKPSGYTFLNRPAGIRGWGYSFNFDHPTTLWKLDIANQTGGGQGYIYTDPTSDDPASGQQVGTFTFADNGQVTSIILKKPTTATHFVVWLDGKDATTLPSVIRLKSYAFY